MYAFSKIATVAGAVVIGLALVQPATAQQSTLSNAVTGAFGASAAHTSCDALQGASQQDCLISHSSPSVTDGAVFAEGPFMRDRTENVRASASTGASAMSSTVSPQQILPTLDTGANPATLLCDPLTGVARANCFLNSSAGGWLQQGW